MASDKADAKVLELPKAEFPYVMRVLADPPFPAASSVAQPTPGSAPPAPAPQQPLLFMLGKPHPFINEAQVIRMYILDGWGVEIYSRNADGQIGLRHTLPWHLVRFVEEAMDAQTTVAEIIEAEAEPDTPEPQAHTNGNGAPLVVPPQA
jgi:hypothetical protein